MDLTEEQQYIVDTITKEDGLFAVNAIAGSGKTSTARAIAESIKPKNGFYTAFNKAIVQDSAKKMGNLVDCRTVHSMAFQATVPFRYSKPIMPFTYKSIKENLTYFAKNDIIKVMNDFFLSDSLDIKEYAAANSILDSTPELVESYVNYMMDGKICPTFNFLLKLMHLMLASGELKVSKDLIILDECQDTSSVTLEIFKHIDCPKKVILGDRYQNIYSFMHTVNAFELLGDDITDLMYLTNSFRCNSNVGDVVERFGKKYFQEDFKYTGAASFDNNDILTEAYISRTNMSLITAMYELLKGGKGFKLLRTPADIFALPLAIENIPKGENVKVNYEYRYIIDEYNNYQAHKSQYLSFLEYLNLKDINEELSLTIRMMDKIYSNDITISEIYDMVVNRTVDKNIILSTVHTMKGLEADKVYICDDLNCKLGKVKYSMYLLREEGIEDVIPKLTDDQKEELNIYYVAISRARKVLDNAIL